MRFNTKKYPILSFLADEVKVQNLPELLKFRTDGKGEIAPMFEKKIEAWQSFEFFKRGGFDCFYLSESFRQSIEDTFTKIWSDDFKKTYVFKPTTKVIINKNWVFLYKIVNESTFTNASLISYRFSGSVLADTASLYPDGTGKVLSDSWNADQDYRREVAFWPLYLEAFLDHAPKDAKFLQPKKKTNEFHCRYFNELPFKVGLLDLNYYTESHQTNPFMVRGHWRLQACGKGLKNRKLKWINSFWKEGYTKGAYMDN